MRHEEERRGLGHGAIHQSRSPRPPSLLIRLSLMHPRRDIYIVVRLAVTDAESIFKMGKLVEPLRLAQMEGQPERTLMLMASLKIFHSCGD